MSPWGPWDPKVQPFASLPKLVKPDCAILVINREMPRSFSLHRQVRSLKYRLSGRKLRKEASCGRGLAVSGVGCGSDSMAHWFTIHFTYTFILATLNHELRTEDATCHFASGFLAGGMWHQHPLVGGRAGLDQGAWSSAPNFEADYFHLGVAGRFAIPSVKD